MAALQQVTLRRVRATTLQLFSRLYFFFSVAPLIYQVALQFNVTVGIAPAKFAEHGLFRTQHGCATEKWDVRFSSTKQLLQRTGKGHVQRSQVATSSKVQGEHLATRPKLKCPGSTGTETTGHVKG